MLVMECFPGQLLVVYLSNACIKIEFEFEM